MFLSASFADAAHSVFEQMRLAPAEAEARDQGQQVPSQLWGSAKRCDVRCKMSVSLSVLFFRQTVLVCEGTDVAAFFFFLGRFPRKV